MKKYIGEFLGTFIHVFIGVGAIIINNIYDVGITPLGIALAFGLSKMAVIYCFGELSGGYFNPAVTFGFWLHKGISNRLLIPYIISQILGATVASFLLELYFPEHDAYVLALTLPSVGHFQALSMEIILTFILVLIALHVATASKEINTLAGIAIGATVTIESLIFGPVSGASMNPARSIGPAIASRDFRNLWIYIIGPIVGSVLAYYAFIYLLDGRSKNLREKQY